LERKAALTELGAPKFGQLSGPSRGRRIHAAIAYDLGVAIVTGQYKPGDILSGEIEFSERLDVSRSAYREAVRMLAAKGLVESRPKAGTRVNERSRWNLLDPDVLAWAFEAEPSEDFIRDLFELRMILEPAAAELAARRRGGAHLERMGHALSEMASHGLATDAGQAADQLFHHSLLDATGNASLISLSSSIEAAVRWTTIFKQRKRGLPRDPLPEHRAVYTAVADGDPEAARAAMAELLRLALRDTALSLGD
jgi:DNA-binding FadR family transcriptional regulator